MKRTKRIVTTESVKHSFIGLIVAFVLLFFIYMHNYFGIVEFFLFFYNISDKILLGLVGLYLGIWSFGSIGTFLIEKEVNTYLVTITITFLSPVVGVFSGSPHFRHLIVNEPKAFLVGLPSIVCFTGLPTILIGISFGWNIKKKLSLADSSDKSITQ